MYTKKVNEINQNFLVGIFKSHLISYPSSFNLNYFWSYGSLAGMCLIIQILTGIFLAMHYTPHVDLAFLSVEHIMRDVNNGWLVRYLHANGASFFFIVVYIHIFRGLYYGSFQKPREHLWCSGVLIFILMMATAFLGYVLPWGQMSFWGATVITNLFSAIPLIGGSIVDWLWGGFSIDNPTLNRFYSFHFLLPFVIAGLAGLHLVLLHNVGSNNPLGVVSSLSLIPFYPYLYIKDVFAFMCFLVFFSFFVFFKPNYLGHPDNYILGNPMVTPAHIVPEWYFLPFYAILRSIPDKLLGVLAMGASLVVLLVLPFVSQVQIRSTFFKPYFKYLYYFFSFNFLLLGWIGQKPVEDPYIQVGLCATILYFFILFFIMFYKKIF